MLSLQGIIDVKNIKKTFGKQDVLKDISLEIPQGEIYGLIGPSGSGKTTLVKMLLGLESPGSGTIRFKGESLKAGSVYASVGYMAQSDALYTELTAKENLNFFAALYSLKKKEKEDRIKIVMETVDLLDHLHKPVALYSGGMKRRLSLAIALLHDPEVLILDEPTVGIDPVLRKQIWERFQELKTKGRTLLITTHVMDEAERCDRLGLLRDGRLLGSEAPAVIKEKYGVSSIEEVFLSTEVN
ncbi:ABC transporter ATP-binding protein [Rossellomorea vietnamensis]|uniref:ABC transporter ATP-binding protein n=2 Tax=Rossellomorea TaxID=2837508 RepID=A0A5D4KDU1_9BACI|nr:ABC transporter ATP-binding protein [Rossellomorea vietnamensis]